MFIFNKAAELSNVRVNAPPPPAPTTNPPIAGSIKSAPGIVITSLPTNPEDPTPLTAHVVISPPASTVSVTVPPTPTKLVYDCKIGIAALVGVAGSYAVATVAAPP